MQENDLRQEKKYCSHLGWAMTLTMVCAFVWQIALLGLSYAGRLNADQTTYMLLALVGYYVLALPLSYWLCRRMPVPDKIRRPMTVRRLGRWFVIGIGLMWLGSLVGSWLNDLVYRVAHLETVDVVTEAFNEMPLAAVLLGACVLGPLCEELMFRGLLAGRLARYGQKPAALVSALLFGLYHANLSQFFYAFALGLLLAYAYFYTGSLKAPVILHMLFNFYGSFIVFILPETGVLPVLYGLSWPVLTIAGVVLLVRGRSWQFWSHGPCEPSMQVVFGNIGMTVAIILCFVQTATMYI